MTIVLPSKERPVAPWLPAPPLLFASLVTRGPACCCQVPPLLMNTQLAPSPPLLPPPLMARVLPSPDSPPTFWPAFPVAPEPNSLVPTWLQVRPLRVKIHAAPPPPLSL